MYVSELYGCSVDGNAKPVVLKENSNTAWVDGKNGLGPVVANFCMDLAIKKASTKSMGWVVAKGSNHIGVSSYYTCKAMEKGLLGLCFSNTPPLVVPTGAKMPALGTNPLSLAAPGKQCDNYVLDMSTSNTAIGKIEVQVKKRKPIPQGWALDEFGKSTTDPVTAFRTGRLEPLGGALTGHKGYALGMLVEVLCGMMADSAYGPHIRKWMTTDEKANLGQAFVCINPECFAPGYKERVSCFLDGLRKMEPADPSCPVQVPGDRERAHMKTVDERGGVAYEEAHLDNMRCIAEKLKIDPMKFK